MASVFNAPHYHDETAAYEFIEARLWPNGPECPRCKETKRVGKLKGKSTRIGIYKWRWAWTMSSAQRRRYVASKVVG